MHLERYRLLAQLGAGSDGVAYRAQDLAQESLVEVRILSGAHADAGRWKPLAKRLRLAALLNHPGAVAVRELSLDHDPPFIVLEWLPKELAAELQEANARSAGATVALGRDLAAALAAAHKFGLVHGRFGPAAVRLGPEPKIDFTGTATQVPLEKLAGLEASCRAPEQAAGKMADFASDVYSLGALLFYLLTEQTVPADRLTAVSRCSQAQTAIALSCLAPDAATAVNDLVAEMLAADPAERPPARVVEERLTALLEALGAEALVAEATVPMQPDAPAVPAARDGPQRPTLMRSLVATVDSAPDAAPEEADEPARPDMADRKRLGRFRLLEKLGEGGMGSVYKAEDITDGTVVAIKVLSKRMLTKANAVKRFHKEARLLAEVNNPYVANLLEVNEDDGILYLVIEFVAGKSLAKLLAVQGHLEEVDALNVLADVARALADAHQRGIIHRDVKPENILLVEPPAMALPPLAQSEQTIDLPAGASAVLAGGTSEPRLRGKLSDFGLARHVIETDSLNVTRAGAVVGTPLYMAPEQCSGNAVIDPRTDVYGMGATLFHMLAGRPPFLADSPLTVMSMHCKEPPPPLKKFNAAIGEGVCQIVEKALAKSPDQRYPDAGALLQDVERLLRGEPTSISIHPKLPPCDPHKLIQYDWTWDLEASPEQLWPHVSNTERLNRAAGVPAVTFTNRSDGKKGVRRFGKFRKAGMTAAWEEHPFEWIEARRMGVLREYSQGPFKWLVSIVELAPRVGGGTTLTHRVRIEPTGLLGRTAAAVEVGIKGRKAVERVYRRIDAGLTGKLGDAATVDFFEEAASLSGSRRRRLEGLLDRLSERHIDPAVLERLGDFLAQAPPQEVARIRPLALAHRLRLDADQVVAACLHGAREGLLVLLWDILCPVCRIPSEVQDTLRLLREHGRCEACNLDFELDFANSVEMIFRAHPEIRDTEVGTYCIGGPVHSPHVVAQVRISPGERIELELGLTEGAYRLRGPQLPHAFDFRVQPGAPLGRCDLSLTHLTDPTLLHTFKVGRQLLALTNDTAQELVVRVERMVARDDALTAARASSLALFRELFPGEILSPGQLVSVANVSLLVTDLDQAGSLYEELGDARAFGLIHEHFRLLDERIRQEGGALVKTVGEGVLAAFSEPVAALKAGLDLQSLLMGSAVTRNLRLRVGIHRGAAMVATLNEHLDYFGTMVNQATRLLPLARGGELVLTQIAAADPHVAALLRVRGLEGEIFAADLPGQPGALVQRLTTLPTATRETKHDLVPDDGSD